MPYLSMSLVQLGLKADLRASTPATSVVSTVTGTACAKEWGAAAYREVSAKDGMNVTEAFIDAAQAAVQRQANADHTAGCCTIS